MAELPPEFQGRNREEARLLALLWPVVNLALPLRIVVPGDTDGQNMLATTRWLLQRVPVVGDEIQVLGQNLPVESVLWTDERKAVVKLIEVRAPVRILEALEAEGWDVSTRDPEPPSEWFEP
ncbi:MAG: hypothetical protein QOE97_1864 [Pseudonocardiales bacterium]|nr:hypothetical protein [Pseudonocardiales bacterium]